MNNLYLDKQGRAFRDRVILAMKEYAEQTDVNPLVVGSANEIIPITNGQVQMMRRKWWQIYKKGWHKHTDFWGNLMWIRYRW